MRTGFALIMSFLACAAFYFFMLVPCLQYRYVEKKHVEVNRTIDNIFHAQKAYMRAHGAYWKSGGTVASATNPNGFSDIAIVIDTTDSYQYRITNETDSTFTCQVTASNLDRDPTPDTWTFDQNGLVLCTSNDLDY